MPAGGLDRRVVGLFVSVISTLVLTLIGVAPASATPVVRIVKEVAGPAVSIIDVYSPAMGKVISNQVLRARPGAPTLVLLNGKGGGLEGDTWQNFTPYEQYFASKNVNVVSPVGGAYSMSTDWRYPDAIRGFNRWQTYLIHELPAALNAHLKANGRNAIAGLSLTGGPALDVAAHGGGVYRAAASFSGCPNVSNPTSAIGLSATLLSGGANPLNMYTPSDWVDHDVSVNPNRLRGKAIYLGSATGIPGAVDGAGLWTGALTLGPAQVEAFSDWCTQQTADAFNRAGVGHVRTRLPAGAHTWALFFAELRDSWRVIGPAIGA